MVFKPINLARQSLLKSFANGYAQSLVAASQSSSASQNTSLQNLGSNVFGLFGRPQAHGKQQHAQHGFHPSSVASIAPRSSQSDASPGLAAYYDAWHRHQKSEEKDWHQFQFAKRIGWKAPTTIPDGQFVESAPAAESSSSSAQRVDLVRANTASAADELRQPPADSPVLASDGVVEPASDAAVESAAADAALAQSASAPVTPKSSASVLAPTDSAAEGLSSPHSTAPTTVVSDAHAYTDQLTGLAESGQYGSIPALFEHMLAAGVVPSASAYNALLLAAMNLVRGKHHVVPKVLDVYTDMLHRGVSPDTSTYAILVELLAARAVEVTYMKQAIATKQARFGGMDRPGSFLFSSDDVESKILAEDDSLSLAVKLFDTAAAVSASHIFSPETYRVLITACAENDRTDDMVRVYADMESRGIQASTAIFAPMIAAFARAADLGSSVECYNEYKALAIAHDNGQLNIVRKDDDIYAAVVKAYATCGRLDQGGMRFFERVRASRPDVTSFEQTVALQALLPHWLSQGDYAAALAHAEKQLASDVQLQAVESICVHAADRSAAQAALQAFRMLDDLSFVSKAANEAVLAMNIRLGNTRGADGVWQRISHASPDADLVEPATMYALSLVLSGRAEQALSAARRTFAAVRSQPALQPETSEQLDEAVDIISSSIVNATKSAEQLSAASGIELIRLMIENGSLVAPVAEHVLASLGPEPISRLPWDDVNVLTHVQARLILSGTHLDVAHTDRFAHLTDMLLSAGLPLEKATSKLIEEVLPKLNRRDVAARWQAYQTPAAAPAPSPPALAFPPSPAFDDSYDPYASSTDFKGSSIIADELDKPNGRHAAHLAEALTKFKNMRRLGRHPRYLTYAKLITAAAKENRLGLAQEILAMAEQDVPWIAHSRVVRQGWVTVFDAMIGACLTVGKRELASRYHDSLLGMGAAPSANTFGLYITTLKESTKTFDEATEAVKIFQRAQAEGVEPSSFLYNALIGKLGKARRIDDCLFYFAEMRTLGIRPTSVTYGTIVNALCRVSDDKFAEELFEEMESMPNYKPRPAPYNSLMQYFLTTKRDRSKVLAYYERMKAKRIAPTMHTYKLLIDAHASLTPVDLGAAEAVMAEIRATGAKPEPVHHAALVHARGCVLQDMAGARALFDDAVAQTGPSAALYQALFESYVANHDVAATEPILARMTVPMTAYIANTLIHGWATAGNIDKARAIYDRLGRDHREPSTYEAMTRAYIATDNHGNAMRVVGEALRRGYPTAVANKICDLVANNSSSSNSTAGSIVSSTSSTAPILV